MKEMVSFQRPSHTEESPQTVYELNKTLDFGGIDLSYRLVHECSALIFRGSAFCILVLARLESSQSGVRFKKDRTSSQY